MKRFFVFLLSLIFFSIVLVSAEIQIGGLDDTSNVINIRTIAEIVKRFTDLLDTPNSYSSFEGQCVAVNSAGTGLIFRNCTNASSTLHNLLANLEWSLAGHIMDTNLDMENHNVTADWFLGRFNWTSSDDWNIFDGATLSFNESKLASTTYLPTNFSTIFGTELEGNNIGNLSFVDNQNFTVQEAAGANALEININFSGVDQVPDFVVMGHQYAGSHFMQLEIWDYSESVWEVYDQINPQASIIKDSIAIIDGANHVSDELVQVRFIHPDNGVPTHLFFIDFINLVHGFSTVTTSEHDGLGGRNNLVNHPQYLDTNGSRNMSGNLNGDLGINLSFDWGYFNNVNTSENIYIGEKAIVGTPGLGSYISSFHATETTVTDSLSVLDTYTGNGASIVGLVFIKSHAGSSNTPFVSGINGAAELVSDPATSSVLVGGEFITQKATTTTISQGTHTWRSVFGAVTGNAVSGRHTGGDIVAHAIFAEAEPTWNNDGGTFTYWAGTFNGNMQIPLDNKRFYWGADNDSYIEFDSDSMNLVANFKTSTDDLVFSSDKFEHSRGVFDLNDDNITTNGAINATLYFGNGSQLTGISAPGDNLGDHIATQNLDMNSNSIDSADDVSANEFMAANGGFGNPSYTFASDPDLGFYRVQANTLGFNAGATFRYLLSTTQMQLNFAGRADRPDISDSLDINTGVFWLGNGILGLSSDDIEVIRVSNGNFNVSQNSTFEMDLIADSNIPSGCSWDLNITIGLICSNGRFLAGINITSERGYCCEL